MRYVPQLIILLIGQLVLIRELLRRKDLTCSHHRDNRWRQE